MREHLVKRPIASAVFRTTSVGLVQNKHANKEVSWEKKQHIIPDICSFTPTLARSTWNGVMEHAYSGKSGGTVLSCSILVCLVKRAMYEWSTGR